MKQILSIAGIVLVSFSFAQEKPVHWTTIVKKLSATSYEVHITAKIDAPWHIYSQTQPKDAINIPVSFDISPNPIAEINSNPKEIGRVEKFKDPTTGIEANEYKGKVIFVQVVKLKSAVKTNIKEVIHYQVCNEEMCLPPMKEILNIAIQ